MTWQNSRADFERKGILKTVDSDLRSQGARVSHAGVHYGVWAPKAAEVAVEILSPRGRLVRSLVLSPSGYDSFYGLDQSGRAGNRYKFRLDKAQSLPDPVSRWQPDGVHGPSMVIDPTAFPWSDAGWQRPAFRDLVIYELHVGAFTPEGTFLSAIEKLKHVRDLGAEIVVLRAAHL